MNTSNTVIRNLPARRFMPDNIVVRKNGFAEREEKNKSGREKEVQYQTFRSDDDLIKSGNRTRAELQQDLLQFHVSYTRNRIGIEKEDLAAGKEVSTVSNTYPAETVTDSQTVQESRNVGPYTLHVSQSAIKRYEEARSYVNWQTTTFETTV